LLLAVSTAKRSRIGPLLLVYIRGSPEKEEPCAHLGEGKDLPCRIELRCERGIWEEILTESGKARKRESFDSFPSETRVKYC
jgi:hypothetical protein